MPYLDGHFWPFDDIAGFSRMAPCMRSCDHVLSFNGCDNSSCWCNKGNLDLRISSIDGCATKSCTFANMNTKSDLDIMSSIQLQYCIDNNASPAGMALPSKVDADPTGSLASTTGTAARTRSTSAGPLNTNDSSSSGIIPPPTSAPPAPSPSDPSSASNPNNNNGGSSGLSIAVKSGIGIGVAFCALIAVLIIVLLFRRRKPAPQHYPANYAGNDAYIPPPPMAPTPYSGNGPYNPPPLLQPAPVYAYKHEANFNNNNNNMGDVSPVSEKAVPVAAAAAAGASTPKVLRKEVKSPTTSQTPVPPSTPGPLPASTALHAQHAEGPREILGDLPPTRHEASNDAQITNTVSIHGMELDSSQQPVSQYPGQPQYQQSGQGYYYNQNVAHEVDSGQSGWGQRQELPAQGAQASWGQNQSQGYQGGPQYGHPYEMPGR